jgi:hypothetical protein
VVRALRRARSSDPVDIDGGSVPERQTPRSRLDGELLGDACEDHRLGATLLERVALVRHRPLD